MNQALGLQATHGTDSSQGARWKIWLIKGPYVHRAPGCFGGQVVGYSLRALFSSVLALGWCLSALALSPLELQQQLSHGEKVTIIDVRSTAFFAQGHIPNAINIPAGLVPQKKVPPLGRVVVYDEGLAAGGAQAAAAALNQKSGIKAEILDGGFAAWETARGLSTKEHGLKNEEIPMITYERLKQAQGQDLVLVDLRKPQPQVKDRLQIATEPLTDLQTEFPGIKITHSPFDVASTKTAAGSASQLPLLVLIDNGDESAREMARVLKANGIKRFAILAGGEQILARKGQAGLQRSGAAVTVRQLSVPLILNTNR